MFMTTLVLVTTVKSLKSLHKIHESELNNVFIIIYSDWTCTWKTRSTFCNSNFSNSQPTISHNVFFSYHPKTNQKTLGETNLTPSFLLPASEEAVSQSNEKSSMASVTNLKLRDGVGTVVPVEAFPKGCGVVFFFDPKNGCQKKHLKKRKVQRRINSWIKTGDSYMFCYMLPCDKSTTSGDLL